MSVSSSMMGRSPILSSNTVMGLNYPRQFYTGAVKYLVLRGLFDPEEIMHEDSMYHTVDMENVLFLARCGYNSHRRDARGYSRLDMIDEDYRSRVVDVMRMYDKNIREVLFEILIPDIGEIVLAYL